MLKRLLAFLLFAVVGQSPALAQDSFPNETVRLFVGFAPGGANDILARLIAEKLSAQYGKPFLVENRPGANGVLAVEAVKRSAPDGHNLLVGPSSAMSVNPVLIKNLSYDPLKDFVPIGMIGAIPLIVGVNPAFPATTIKELIALAKEKPGTINYASAASSFQVATEMFAHKAGVKLFHVPYRGSGPAVTAVLTNSVPLIFGDVAAMTPLVQGNKLRPLAVTSSRRLATFPDVPTVSEAGVPGYEMVFWSGLFAPVGTPGRITQQLERDLARIVAMPDVQARMKALGVEPAGTPGAELTPRIAREIAAFREVAEAAGMTAQ